MSQPGKENHENTNLINHKHVHPSVAHSRRNAGTSHYHRQFTPVGITFGQTARITSGNIGQRLYHHRRQVFRQRWNILAEFGRHLIEPGKIISFDLNGDDIVREGNRIQIRGVLEGPEPHLRGAVISVEVFNNADGKTTVFVIGPEY